MLNEIIEKKKRKSDGLCIEQNDKAIGVNNMRVNITL